jgi:hypothetical protein
VKEAAAGWGWRLSRITARDVRLLTEAQWVLLACQLEKWRRPTGQLVARQTGTLPAADGTPDWSVVASVAWAVTRSARFGLFRPQCLVRSLAIRRMLVRRGIVTGSVQIGVRTENGAFQAHAWVELNGAVVGDTVQHVGTFTKVSDARLVEL